MKGEIIDRIKNYLYSRDEAIAAYVFGFYFSGKVRPKSDIDIAVLLSDTVDSKDLGTYSDVSQFKITL